MNYCYLLHSKEFLFAHSPGNKSFVDSCWLNIMMVLFLLRAPIFNAQPSSDGQLSDRLKICTFVTLVEISAIAVAGFWNINNFIYEVASGRRQFVHFNCAQFNPFIWREQPVATCGPDSFFAIRSSDLHTGAGGLPVPRSEKWKIFTLWEVCLFSVAALWFIWSIGDLQQFWSEGGRERELNFLGKKFNQSGEHHIWRSSLLRGQGHWWDSSIVLEKTA